MWRRYYFTLAMISRATFERTGNLLKWGFAVSSRHFGAVLWRAEGKALIMRGV